MELEYKCGKDSQDEDEASGVSSDEILEDVDDDDALEDEENDEIVDDDEVTDETVK